MGLKRVVKLKEFSIIIVASLKFLLKECQLVEEL